MKKAQIQVGAVYSAKVSGKVCPVRVDAVSIYGGWDGLNLETGRTVHIKSPQRLRRRLVDWPQI